MSTATGPSGGLDEILRATRAAVQEQKARQPLQQLREQAGRLGPRRGFARRLREAAETGAGVIAEIKFRSPSAGEIRAGASAGVVAGIARQYEAAGAACLSVLTEPQFFGGGPEFLRAAREATGLPVLRKDFLVDPWQVWESAAMGADAVLLIAAALDGKELQALAAEARLAGVEVLAEVHSREEMELVLATPELEEAPIGVNNRNLRTLETDPDNALRMLPLLPPGRTLVAASGYGSAELVRQAMQQGIQAFLTGESLMKAEHPGQALRELFFS